MKIKNLISVIALLVMFYNCSSSDDEPTPIPNPNPTANITYNGNIKSIMSSFCTSCHGSPTTNGAPMSLTTYSQVKSALENRGLVNRINSITNPMPQSGLMSQSNRDLIQQWIDDGLLEN